MNLPSTTSTLMCGESLILFTSNPLSPLMLLSIIQLVYLNKLKISMTEIHLRLLVNNTWAVYIYTPDTPEPLFRCFSDLSLVLDYITDLNGG